MFSVFDVIRSGELTYLVISILDKSYAGNIFVPGVSKRTDHVGIFSTKSLFETWKGIIYEMKTSDTPLHILCVSCRIAKLFSNIFHNLGILLD